MKKKIVDAFKRKNNQQSYTIMGRKANENCSYFNSQIQNHCKIDKLRGIIYPFTVLSRCVDS